MPYDQAISAALGAAAVSGSNNVYVIAVTVPLNMVISNVNYRIDTGQASGKIAFGLYDMSGNKVLDSGALTATASSTYFQTQITETTVTNGFYYAAYTANNASISLRMVSAAVGSVNVALMNQGTPYVYGYGSNQSTDGSLPSTLGTIISTNVVTYPLFIFKGGN